MSESVCMESSRDPNWSVTIYPDHLFDQGAGWYMHPTSDPEDTKTPGEVKEIAGESVMEELAAIGNFVAWG